MKKKCVIVDETDGCSTLYLTVMNIHHYICCIPISVLIPDFSVSRYYKEFIFN